MEDELYTGMWLLNDKGSGLLFGAVGAFGSADHPGTVRMTLRNDRVQLETNENGDITIDLPEHQARQLVEELFVVAVKLEHLRLLERNRLRDGKATPEG
jgi:hypothetical protein